MILNFSIFPLFNSTEVILIAIFIRKNCKFKTILICCKGHDQKALEAMKRLYGPKYDINTKLDLIKIGLQNKDSKRTTKKSVLLKSFKNAEVYKPFLIIVLLGVVQQFSGMTILRAYVVKIFNGIFQALENESIDSFDKSKVSI